MSKSSGVIAPRSEAEAFFRANPDVDSIEMIYTDMGGVPPCRASIVISSQRRSAQRAASSA